MVLTRSTGDNLHLSGMTLPHPPPIFVSPPPPTFVPPPPPAPPMYSNAPTPYLITTTHLVLTIGKILVHSGGLLALVYLLLMHPFAPAHATSLDMQRGNFVYEHKVQALKNPALLTFVKMYHPCDMGDTIENVDLLLQNNERLCNKVFPPPITLMTIVNVTTLKSRIEVHVPLINF